MIVDPDKLELERCLCGAEAEAWEMGTIITVRGMKFEDVTTSCLECGRYVAITIEADSPSEREAARTMVAWHWNAFIIAVKNTQTKTV